MLAALSGDSLPLPVDSPVALEALTRRPAALTDDQQSMLFGMVACEESA